LAQAFSEFGEVEFATVVLDRETKKSKGFWFVTFVNLEDAKKALAETNEKELEWRKIFVSYAKENTERPAKTF
jgi:RNA recognition motif-containing protein